MKLKLTTLFITLLCLTACNGEPIEVLGNKVTPNVTSTLSDRQTLVMPFETQSGQGELSAYVAKTDEEKAQGLMFVESLPKEHGMIFIYDSMAQPIFWMKNMKISLDFIYLDDTGTVVDLLENIPPCTAKKDEECERYHPNAPSQYVVEVPAGWVEEVGLKVGDGFGLDQIPL